VQRQTVSRKPQANHPFYLVYRVSEPANSAIEYRFFKSNVRGNFVPIIREDLPMPVRASSKAMTIERALLRSVKSKVDDLYSRLEDL
jgi:hypothetical protein